MLKFGTYNKIIYYFLGSIKISITFAQMKQNIHITQPNMGRTRKADEVLAVEASVYNILIKV